MNAETALHPSSDRTAEYAAHRLKALQQMGRLEAYYRWTYEAIRPHLGRRILDAGCGIGSFTRLAAEHAELVVAVDHSEENTEMVRAFAEGYTNVRAKLLDLEGDLSPLAPYSFDTIVSLDVIEHIRDDVAVLRAFRTIAPKGARLLVKVPACPWLYGSLDAASGHFRRYHPDELRGKAEAAGWRPLRVRYMNLSGVAPYFLKARILKKRTTFSRSFRPWQLGVIERAVPFLRLVDRLTGPPVGQSLILVADVP